MSRKNNGMCVCKLTGRENSQIYACMDIRWHIDSTAGLALQGSPFLSSNKATYPADLLFFSTSENVPVTPVISCMCKKPI